jgi:hypothetical protein
MLHDMKGHRPLEQRLSGYGPRTTDRSVSRAAFSAGHLRGLRARLDAKLEHAVRIFETDRLLYDIEVDALHAWLRNLMAFDAYCARREGSGGDGTGAPPVR